MFNHVTQCPYIYANDTILLAKNFFCFFLAILTEHTKESNIAVIDTVMSQNVCLGSLYNTEHMQSLLLTMQNYAGKVGNGNTAVITTGAVAKMTRSVR